MPLIKLSTTFKAELKSHLHQEDVLEKPLRKVFGIIVLVLVKEIWPTISSHKIIRVVIADICPMPAVMPPMSERDIHYSIGHTRDWTNHIQLDRAAKPLHHDRSHAQP